MVIPLKAGFEGGRCRYLQNDPAIEFVTYRSKKFSGLKNLSEKAFEAPSTFGIIRPLNRWSVLFLPNLPASVRRTRIGAPPNSASTIRLEKIRAETG